MGKSKAREKRLSHLLGLMLGLVGNAHGQEGAIAPEIQRLAVGVTVVEVEGMEAAFSARTGKTEGVGGGIEELYVYERIDEDTSLTLQGHWLEPDTDQALSIVLRRHNWGQLQIDWQRFDTYYADFGAYIEPLDYAYTSDTPLLGLRRDHLLVQLTLDREALPKVTLTYERRVRAGSKSHLVWGENKVGTGVSTERRSVVPSVTEVDEVTDSGDIAVEKHIGKQRIAASAHIERTAISNRHATRRDAASEDGERYVTTHQRIESDYYTLYGSYIVHLSRSVIFSAAASYTRLNADYFGDRIYGDTVEASYDRNYDRRNRRGRLTDVGYIDLTGFANLQQSVATLNLSTKPSRKLKFINLIRFEKLSKNAQTESVETAQAVNLVTRQWEGSESALDARGETAYKSGLWKSEIRYQMGKKALVYAGVIAENGNGSMDEAAVREGLLPNPGADEYARDYAVEYSRNRYKAEIGYNYYPTSAVTLSGQIYAERGEREYAVVEDRQLDPAYRLGYPGVLQLHEIKTIDGNIRLVCRAGSSLRAVTRFDYQQRQIETKEHGALAVDSLDVEAWIYSQSLVWVPHPRVMAEVGYHAVRERYWTPAAALVGRFEGLMPESRSDSESLAITLYGELKEGLSIELGYRRLRADNYVNTWEAGQPYGVSLSEDFLSVGLRWQLSAHLHWQVRYGYYDSVDGAADGLRDYTAHLVSTGIRLQF